MNSGGGWAAILYTLRMANRVGWLPLWHAMRARTPARPARSAWAARRRHAQRRRPLARRSARSRFRPWSPTCRRASRPSSSRATRSPQLRTLSPRELEWCGRLVDPALRRARTIRTIASSPGTTRSTASPRSSSASGPTRSFFYASGRSSNEAGFLLQLFARLYGTNYVNNCSYYCHQASGVGLRRPSAPAPRRSRSKIVEHADLFFLIGGNPASNHPRLMRTLMNIRAARRPRHRHQPGAGSSASSTSACPPTCAACCSAPRSPASTCSRTSAATSRC